MVVIDCVTVTVAVVLNAEADEVAEPVVDKFAETLLKEVELIVERVPLVLVGTVMDDVDELLLAVVADELLLAVVADELVAVPPQTMFSDTARGVAYTVGLELALAAEEA